jgi:hypothetical protein
MRARAIALVFAIAASIASSAQPRQVNALDDLRRFVRNPAG